MIYAVAIPASPPRYAKRCYETIARLIRIRDWHLAKYQEGEKVEPLKPTHGRTLPEGVAADEIDDTRWHVETYEERRKRLGQIRSIGKWGLMWS